MASYFKEGLANLFGIQLAQPEPNERLAQYLPPSYLEMIPEQDRATMANLAHRSAMSAYSAGENPMNAAQKTLIDMIKIGRAESDRKRASRIMSGAEDPTIEQSVLSAPGNESGAPDFRTAASRLEQAQQNPPQLSTRDQLIRRFNQFQSAGMFDYADKLSEQIKRIDEEFGNAETVLDKSGKPILVRQGKYGGSQVLPYAPTPKVREVSVGDKRYLVDENRPDMQTLREFEGVSLPTDVITASLIEGLPLTTNPNALTPDQRAILGSRIEQNKSATAGKVSVNTNDPTAVAKAQMDVLRAFDVANKEAGDPEIASRFQSMQSAISEANRGNPQADGAIIYSVAKILDPAAAVQEGDKKTVLGARNMSEQVRGRFEKWVNGGSLTPNERANLYRVATGIVQKRSEAATQRVRQYQSFATSLGGKADLIVNPYGNIQFDSVMRDSGNQTQPTQPGSSVLPGPTQRPVSDYFKNMGRN
jgi:hypothetical protein